jgi:hypothetical protein
VDLLCPRRVSAICPSPKRRLTHFSLAIGGIEGTGYSPRAQFLTLMHLSITDEAVVVIREVRRVASRAGFYTMCVRIPSTKRQHLYLECAKLGDFRPGVQKFTKMPG